MTLTLVQKLALFAGLSSTGCGAVTALRDMPLSTPGSDVVRTDATGDAVVADARCAAPVACASNVINQPCAVENESCNLQCASCVSGSCRIAPDGCLRWQGLLGGGPLAPPELDFIS